MVNFFLCWGIIGLSVGYFVPIPKKPVAQICFLFALGPAAWIPFIISLGPEVCIPLIIGIALSFII